MKLRKNSLLSLLMLGVDALTVAAVFTICYRVCWLRVLTPDQPYGGSYWRHLLLAVAIYTLMMLAFRVGRSLWRNGQAQEYFICCLASFAAGFLYFVISRRQLREGNRIIPFYFYFLVMCAVSLALVSVRLFYRMLRSTSQMNMRTAFVRHRTVLVGGLDEAALLLSDIAVTQYCNIHPLAVVPTDSGKFTVPEGRKLLRVPLRSLADGLSRIVRDTGADLIILLPAADGKLPCMEAAISTGCRVCAAPPDCRLAGLRDVSADEILGGDLVAPPTPTSLGCRRILVCGGLDRLSVRLSELIGSGEYAASGIICYILGCGHNSGLARYDRAELDEIFREFAPDALICTLPRIRGFRPAAVRVLEAAAAAPKKPDAAVFLIRENGKGRDELLDVLAAHPGVLPAVRLLRVPSPISELPPTGGGTVSLLTDGEAAALTLSVLGSQTSGVTELAVHADTADADTARGIIAQASRPAEFTVTATARLRLAVLRAPLSNRAAPTVGAPADDAAGTQE